MASKKQKYDRQIRIWGEHGQRALETADVCLLNCGPTGSEALKNLVLGGIGSFTLVDGKTVDASDLGNNYLVQEEYIGKLRVKAVSALLHELNDSVKAKFVEEAPETLIESNPNFFKSFSLVIATQLPEHYLLKLDHICREAKVKLLIGRSYGLVGSVRISVEEHCVIESKPDNAMDDLRLLCPWPELLQYAQEFDLDTEDPVIHKHIPFGVILILLAAKWKASHGSKAPLNSKERNEFKALISGGMRELDEDNYKEAMASAFKVWAPPALTSTAAELRSLLNDSSARAEASRSDFWVMAAALKEFVDSEGDVPLQGSIPDMHSTTEFYVGLQRVYQVKAEADVSLLEYKVRELLKRVGRDPESVPRDAIKLLCKNARNLKVLRYQTLAEEFSQKSGQSMAKLLASEDNIHAAIYTLLRASDHFASVYNRFPGVFHGEPEEEDMARLKSAASGILSELGVPFAPMQDDLVTEMCRFGAAELHAVAAIVGGVLSQEAIKLITGQFTPLLGTWVFNGMASTSAVIQF